MSALFDRQWAVYICGLQGHLVRGAGTGTATENIVWADHCERCGAKLAAASVPGAVNEETGE